jgi:hypothetical protein
VKKTYHTIGKQGKANQQELAGFLTRNGQALLPMADLIEQCQLACDELIDVTGRAAIQAVLQLSAIEAAGGPQQQGKRRSGDVVFYGRQAGQVLLSDRKLEVQRPRLRSKGRRSREVEVPAYAAMQNPTPTKAWRGSRNWRHGWTGSIRRRRPACWKACTGALHHQPARHPAGAAPLSGDPSRVRTPESASRPAALLTGRTARWCCAGWLRRCCSATCL